MLERFEKILSRKDEIRFFELIHEDNMIVFKFRERVVVKTSWLS
jgi:hypothetical protein